MLHKISITTLIYFSSVIFDHHFTTFALDNGLARKPPMGWMSWTKFYCEIDCERHPFSCINEDLYMAMADRMAEDGYLAAGYEFVHIDDCWMAMNRDSNGRLLANATRFPSGIPALGKYLHKLGLKFGIYEDYGTSTCGGYPGSYDHLEVDAKTFAEWEVDYLKLDGCNIDVKLMETGYPQMEEFLNLSGHGIVYSCSWPAYLIDKPEMVDYQKIGKFCNLWRNFDDISRSWQSVMSIINYYNKNQDILIPAQGPGRWNDPDMIIVGNTELTVDQARAQMTIWAIWSAPLIMSNDLRTITPEFAEILLNREAIAIDQDPIGAMGRLIFSDANTYVYVKKITPIDTARKVYSYAVAILNYSNNKIKFTSDLASLGLSNPGGYNLLDIWSGRKLGHFLPSAVYEEVLTPTSAAFLKASLPDLDMHYINKDKINGIDEMEF